MDHYSTDMRVGEAAEFLGVRRQHVWRLIKAGKLPGSRYTERWGHVIPRASVEAYRRAALERERSAVRRARDSAEQRGINLVLETMHEK